MGEQLKTDLRLLALRGAFDPKRFYRNPDATKFPKYFQMGTVVEGPTDFYSGALQLLLAPPSPPPSSSGGGAVRPLPPKHPTVLPKRLLGRGGATQVRRATAGLR